LRLVVEELPDEERIARAAILAPNAIPRSLERARASLKGDRDPLLAPLVVTFLEENPKWEEAIVRSREEEVGSDLRLPLGVPSG
jgi:hypothetical protein